MNNFNEENIIVIKISDSVDLKNNIFGYKVNGVKMKTFYDFIYAQMN